MASVETDLTPRRVPEVETKYRRIGTDIPVPESVPILEGLRRHEPRSMGGQPPVLWDRAEGCRVFDRWGNCWLDWSSGVLVTNAGHNHPRIRQAMLDQIGHGLVHNYCFPSEIRSRLVARLAGVAPEGLDKVFLLTTGSEACECCLKLARTHGRHVGGAGKITFVTFDNAFHGRTLGSQMAGGIAGLKEWIGNLDPDIVQAPFPDGFRCGSDTGFDVFTRTLGQLGIDPERVCGVMTETYQGGNASFAPPEYIQKLRAWCEKHNALLIFDEVQAGFGRTGAYWGFEHYGTVPDLIACGKGITSGMPLSAALANLDVIDDENLVENARRLGAVLQPELRRIGERFADYVGAVHGKGLVASLHVVRPGGIEPDARRATDIVLRCVEKGLMMFAPVGYAGASVKISPPLVVTEEPLREGIAVLEEAMEEICQ